MARTLSIKKKEVLNACSERTYYNVMGGMLCYGFLVNMIAVLTCQSFVESISPVMFTIMYCISAIVGALMVNLTNSPVLSFVGYNLIVVPIGLLLSVCLPYYPKELIAASFFLTLVITIGMMVVSNMKPNFFRGIGAGLFVALLFVCIGELILLVLGVHLGWIDFLVVGIFALFIGYDWVRAGDRAKSITAAIDSAANLYLDIINIFTRILSILSKED